MADANPRIFRPTSRRHAARLAAACLGACAALFGGAATCPAGDDPADLLAPRERGFVEWFDGLGCPALGSLPFVRVRWIPSGSAGGRADATDVSHGFLVEDRGAEVVVLGTDLRSRTHARSGTPGTRSFDVEVTPVDLEAFVRDGVRARRRSKVRDREGSDRTDPFETRVWWGFDGTWRLAVLARACAARDLRDAARTLFDLAYEDGLDPSFAPARAAIAEEAWIEVEEAIVAPGASDAARVGAVETWLRRFGSGSPSRARAVEHRDVLRAMATEHEARAGATGPPDASLPAPERAAAWVRRLEDATEGTRSRRSSAAAVAPVLAEEALAAMGLDAVPALLAALDDRRLTRGWTWAFRDRGWQRPMHEVRRVGDVALGVLQRISANGIDVAADAVPADDRSIDGGIRVGSASRAIVVEAARRWYDEVLAVGEVPWLVQRVRRGPRAVIAAARLVEVAPETAIDVLAEVLRTPPAPDAGDGLAPPEPVRRHDRFLELLQGIPGDRATAVIAELQATARDAGSGVALALTLARRGDPRGLQVLLRAWPRLRAAHDDAGLGAYRSDVVRAFVGSDDVEALEALAELVRDGGVAARLSVVLPLVARESTEWSWSTGQAYAVERPIGDGPRSAASSAALERLLADLLEDDARSGGAQLHVDGVRVDPVVGELAAWALARRFPDRWTFDVHASARERRRSRVAAANAWRARQGRPPLPAPLRAVVRSAEVDARVEVAARTVAAASDAAVRAAALATLEAEGVRAVPALIDARAAVPSDAPGRASLLEVAGRLALRVSRVTVAGVPLAGDGACLQAWEALRGRTVDGALVVAVLTAFTAHRPPGAVGLRVRILRDGEGGGATLSATLSASPASAGPNRDVVAHTGPWVRRDGSTRFGGSGVTAAAFAGQRDVWTSWARTVDDALVGVAPDEDVEIGFTVAWVP